MSIEKNRSGKLTNDIKIKLKKTIYTPEGIIDIYQ